MPVLISIAGIPIAQGGMKNPGDFQKKGDAKWSAKYVELDILDNSGKIWGVRQLTEAMKGGKRFVMLGDYGAGKSTTMKEVFSRALKRFPG